MMTNIEMNYMNRVPNLLNEIAKQLKIANELKALELKEKNPVLIRQIDDLFGNGN